MTRSRLVSWLPLAAALALVAFASVWITLGIAGNRESMRTFPDAAGSRVELLDDPDGSLNIAAVAAAPASAWAPWDNEDYIRSAQGGAVWARVTLKNPGDRPLRGVLADAEFYTDLVDLWTPDARPPDAWRRDRSGERTPAADKALRGRDTAFFVEVPAGGERVVYLRAEDHFGAWVRLVWWPDERAFFAAQTRITFGEGGYFGVLLALFVYNAVIWARLRHRDLGYYLGYLAFMGVFMLMMRAHHQTLGVTLSSPFPEMISMGSMTLSIALLTQFAREFLSLSSLAPRLDQVARIMRAVMIALACSAAAVPWFNNTFLLYVAVVGTVATHLLLLVLAITAWRAGSAYARYFALSFGILFLGAFPTVASWLLALPFATPAVALMIGSASEMLLLSLAISDRFARLQRDSLAATLAEEKARLELLRYQLNPHFLFNALNSIYGLVYPHSRPAGDLVRRLADFCRLTFTRDGNQWRPLRDELAMLRMYLDIEQTRWRDRLVIEFATDPAADAAPLPAFLLLPLAENAIKHGGATSPDILTVRLTTRALPDDAIEIAVANTGRFQAPGEPRSVSSHGLGLENLRARLARNFPASHQLDIATPAGWVVITLRLPRLTPPAP